MFLRQLRAPVICGVMLFLQGCYGLEKASDATLASYGLRVQSQGAGCGSGLSTFQSAVYPYLKANCVDCHGAGVTPLVAASDPNQAYANAKTYLNLANVESSILYSRGKDGHCGDVGCSKDGVALLAALKSWSSAETGGSACGSTAPTGTTGTPADIPNSGVLLRLNGVSLQAVVSASQQAKACVPYEIAFVQDNVASVPSKDITVDFVGSGIFQDPTCQNSILSSIIPTTANTGATIFYVRNDVVGNYDIIGSVTGYALGFSLQLSITAAPAPSPTPSPTVSPKPSPTPSPTVSPKPSPTPSPTVSPKPSPTPSPTPVATPCTTTQKQNAYSATVWGLAKTNCASCHTTGGQPQFGNATLSTAYTIAKSLVTVSSASSSRLYLKSKDGHCGSKCSSTTGASFLAEMQRWFPAETTTNCSALTTPH